MWTFLGKLLRMESTWQPVVKAKPSPSNRCKLIQRDRKGMNLASYAILLQKQNLYAQHLLSDLVHMSSALIQNLSILRTQAFKIRKDALWSYSSAGQTNSPVACQLVGPQSNSAHTPSRTNWHIDCRESHWRVSYCLCQHVFSCARIAFTHRILEIAG
jgi:hypothetical protein